MHLQVEFACKEFAKYQENHMFSTSTKNGKHRNKPNRMSDAEIILIMILFHSGGYRCFKHFYLEYVCKHLAHLFPRRVSYNRFVELEKEVLFPMVIFIKTVLLGTCTGISFVDSTPLRVCLNPKIHIHKMATPEKCYMGWCFGFKLHLTINDKWEILNFMFIPADADNMEPLNPKSVLHFLDSFKIFCPVGRIIFRSTSFWDIESVFFCHILGE